MASSRRTARTLLAGACVVPLLALPGVASAAPPEQPRASGPPAGQERPEHAATDRGTRGGANHSASGRGQPEHRATPPGQARTSAEPAPRTTSAATTSSTTSGTTSTRGPADGASTTTASHDDRPGRGIGRTAPPGRVAKQDPADRELAGGASTPGASDAPSRPAATPAPAAPTGSATPTGPRPVDVPSATPNLPAAPPSFAVAVPTTPSPGATTDGATAPGAAAASSDRGWAWDLDDRVEGLLDDVAGSVQRGLPEALGPVSEPLSDLVPMLLLVLGAFLVAQRGIGRGLGHVPMADGRGTPRRTPGS